jgi:alpha-glucosidase
MTDTPWWQRGIVYQVYPRSFQDTNDDGIGDLQGVRRRLDYLTWLGVDALWLSPIFPSPMADFGYDISDYRAVDTVFGTLTDFDQLVEDAHARGLKLILDFVPNHTSEQHPWFLESRSSRRNPKRDWYLWRDPSEDGGPPNNWLANFGGSGWEFDISTGQYYYHAFLKEQPDLNWRNPEVRRAMFGVLRFWLDRGVDGFRVDVLWLLIKDDLFRDNPPNPAWRPGQPGIERRLQQYTADRPEIHELVHEMRAILDAYPDRVLIGEIYLPLTRLVTYYGENLRGAQLPFNFQLISAPWTARDIARVVDDYEAALPAGGWPNWVLGNHDQKRIATRIGAAAAPLAAMLLLTLRGTPTLYYGDELGLENVAIPANRLQDPWAKSEPGLGFGRDPERTPMPWDNSENAGFTAGSPWLPLNSDHEMRNVAALAADPRSILTLHRRLIALRREHTALSVGRYIAIQADDDVLSFERCHAGSRLLVMLNFAYLERRALPPADSISARILLSSRLDREGEQVTGEVTLRSQEGLLLELASAVAVRDMQAGDQ